MFAIVWSSALTQPLTVLWHLIKPGSAETQVYLMLSLAVYVVKLSRTRAAGSINLKKAGPSSSIKTLSIWIATSFSSISSVTTFIFLSPSSSGLISLRTSVKLAIDSYPLIPISGLRVAMLNILGKTCSRYGPKSAFIRRQIRCHALRR